MTRYNYNYSTYNHLIFKLKLPLLNLKPQNTKELNHNLSPMKQASHTKTQRIISVETRNDADRHRFRDPSFVFSINVRGYGCIENEDGVFAGRRLARPRISVAVLRSAVKFSTLQSYEFVPRSNLRSQRATALHLPSSYTGGPPGVAAFFRFHARDRPLLFLVRFHEQAGSTFDDYTALYDTRYPSSEILCLAAHLVGPRRTPSLAQTHARALWPPPESSRGKRNIRGASICSCGPEIILKP